MTKNIVWYLGVSKNVESTVPCNFSPFEWGKWGVNKTLVAYWQTNPYPQLIKHGLLHPYPPFTDVYKGFPKTCCTLPFLKLKCPKPGGWSWNAETFLAGLPRDLDNWRIMVLYRWDSWVPQTVYTYIYIYIYTYYILYIYIIYIIHIDLVSPLV